MWLTAVALDSVPVGTLPAGKNQSATAKSKLELGVLNNRNTHLAVVEVGGLRSRFQQERLPLDLFPWLTGGHLCIFTGH